MSISERDFNGRLLVPVITLPLLPLSNKASQASCNILFSFLTIISGAFKLSNLCNLLFLLITLRYKSFKSDVANRPPSRGTSGRNSGGITGITFNIIHSGLSLDSKKASINFKRLTNFFFFVSDDVAAKSSLTVFFSSWRSISERSFCIASAPIILSKLSPCSSLRLALVSSSSISYFFIDLTIPGSVTIKLSKYKTFSRSFKAKSKRSPILLGSDFKNQI